MQFTEPLKPATLIRRYKRFLADLCLPDGRTRTVHCPNSGSMKTCSEPGSPVYYSRSPNPGRTYPHTLEMVASEGTWVGINTGRSNTIVAEALLRGSITEIAPVESLKKEVRTSTGNRLDLVAVSNSVDTYIEVKNCTYVEDRCALFPDAVTARGTKHLQELTRLAQAGRRAVIFFLVQRLDADRFAPAGNIDPLYAETLSTAQAQGVEVLAYQAAVSPTAIDIVRPLPLDLTLSL